MNQVVPQLQQQFYSYDLYFQQDGDPAHHSSAVWEYLDETFPETWIGQRGPIDWSARLWIIFFWRGEYSKTKFIVENQEVLVI